MTIAEVPFNGNFLQLSSASEQFLFSLLTFYSVIADDGNFKGTITLLCQDLLQLIKLKNNEHLHVQ